MRFCIETLGCKVNQFETQALETILTSRGHTICKSGCGCDAFIINTCAVTAESGRKSRQAIRRGRIENPGAIIAVCGCYSQISPDEVKTLGVDIIAGSADRIKFADALEKAFSDRSFICMIDDPIKRCDYEELPAGSLSGRTRAMLKIQDGCLNFCSYCIIPFARGPVRSLPPERAASEAARLCSEGYRELILTGIEISSYGKDLANISLSDVINAVCASAPGCRIRLGSLEPRTITPEFCEEISGISNLCRHFHLSLQSGCDATLRRMNRKYDTSRYLYSVELLRKYFPGCGITTDLIVGFPGETDDEFSETVSFIQKCSFSGMHIFPYSVRPGTPAASMPGQIKRAVKASRARTASAVAAEMSNFFAKKCIGQTYDVLFETEDGEYSYGHADNYLDVRVKGIGLHNNVLPVQITGAENATLFGEISNTSI